MIWLTFFGMTCTFCIFWGCHSCLRCHCPLTPAATPDQSHVFFASQTLHPRWGRPRTAPACCWPPEVPDTPQPRACPRDASLRASSPWPVSWETAARAPQGSAGSPGLLLCSCALGPANMPGRVPDASACLRGHLRVPWQVGETKVPVGRARGISARAAGTPSPCPSTCLGPSPTRSVLPLHAPASVPCRCPRCKPAPRCARPEAPWGPAAQEASDADLWAPYVQGSAGGSARQQLCRSRTPCARTEGLTRSLPLTRTPLT